ncbi:Hpt domain-containing protein [Niveibacterium sp. 24ML]|uniref:hybrid sensor histidine kinase/response regulator n=1 Tax=Niveibacterium sp. 24ML TaxID=2985512 RepID=UPI00226E9D1A|nr:Hpt domain-containing protein [Niveibacterium sp. 24ML]MCX9155803.1 Hpt domain-containing protein [Niveibacterium sp. 24ML]
MNSEMDLDIAPLTWVRGEIDAALARALEALNKVEAGEDRSQQLRFAQNHVHQVQGALSVVGLDGVTQFAEALDACFASLASGELAYADEHVPLLRRALIALGNYLAELQDGAPNQPLRLYPLYAEIAEARGGEAPGQSELFFPNLSARPALGAPISLAPDLAAKELRTSRARFEKGLLSWLREPGSDAGPRLMLVAIQRIAQINPAPGAQGFWWSSIAFFEGLAQRAIKADREAQRLCRRIDTQMKRLLEGSHVVAERLVRDVLFHVASSDINTEHARAVRQAFHLDSLLPGQGEARLAETPLAPVQRALREAIDHAKESWNKFAAGSAVGLPQMQDYLAAARAPLQTLHQPAVARLIEALHGTATWLRKDPLKSSDDLSMDVATALLIAEQAVDPVSAPSQDILQRQVDALIARLAAREVGRDPGELDEHLFGESSRRAQERLFFNQLAREIQTSLGQVEQTLDTFFRNPASKSALAALTAPLKQVQGAFAMLGEVDAAALVASNAERVEQLAQAEAAEPEVCEQIAHEFSALGFFVEALRFGPARLERFLTPEGGAVAPEAPATIEAEVRQQSRETQQLIQQLAEAPADQKVRDELKQNLETLRDDAALLADTKLEQQAREALAALKTGDDSGRVQEAVAAIAPAPAPEQSAETARLIAASEDEVDAELLAIFLEEAHEVLETIRSNGEAAEREPHNHENIVTVRRGFHTLKGSSRMVGLNEFSEPAKAVEFALNRWLQQERDATQPFLELVAHAHQLFSDWVAQLEAGGSTWRDASALINRVQALEALLDGVTPAPQPALTSAAPDLVPAEPVPADPAPLAPSQDHAQSTSGFGEFDLELDSGQPELDLAATLLAPVADAAEREELSSVDLTATLLAPFDEAIEQAQPAPSLLPEMDELSAESIDHEEVFDLTASLTGPDDLESLTREPEPEVEVPDMLAPFEAPAQPQPHSALDPTELDFNLEEVELTDEEAMPSRANEEEMDLTATLLAPLEMREAFLNPPQEEAPVQAPDVEALPVLDLTLDAGEEPKPVEPAQVAEAPLHLPPPESELTALGQDLPEPEYAPPPVSLELAVPEAAGEQASGVLEPVAEVLPEPPVQTSLDAVELEVADELPIIEPAAPQAVDEGTDEASIAELAALDDVGTTQLEGSEPQVPAELIEPVDLALDPAGLDDHEFDDLDVIDSVAGDLKLDEPEPVAIPEPDLVRLGTTEISRQLFDLYIAEAHQHVGTLREELPRFQYNPVLVPQEPVIRAAHTLGGISGTARVDSVRALAKALEHALARLHLANVAPTPDQADLFAATGVRLDAMVAEIDARMLPLATPELVDALEGLTPFTEIEETVDDATQALSDIESSTLSVTPAPEVVAEEESIAAEPVAIEPALESLGAASQLESDTLVSPIAAPEAPEPERTVVHDELDDDLLPIFFEEAEELIRDLSSEARKLHDPAEQEEGAKAVARLLHSIKGSARMAGAMNLGEYVHGLENRLIHARDAAVPGAHLADEVENGIDTIGHMIQRMQRGEPAVAPHVAPVAAAAHAPEATPAAPSGASQAAAAPASKPAVPASVLLDEAEAQAGPRATLRVRSDMVDRFVNEAGEISIARTRIEGELRTLRRSLLDLTENVIRLRNQLREVEIAAETQMQTRAAQAEHNHEDFDPLEFDRFTRFQELTRMMAESVGDVTTIQQNLLKNLDAADTALHVQGRLSRDLQQALMGVRMVPFEELTDRLYRVVRQTAKELGKRANLDIRGGSIEIDRGVLDKMTAPIEHLLRNAVAHGLETPEERRAANKPEIGQISLSVYQRSNEVGIELADDGRGLDFDGIRKRAEARGFLAAGEAASEARLTQFIFEAGFTTADKVSEVAGRGVGMDVVKSETTGVGGRIDISSVTGQGAKFVVHLPLTLAVTQALLVRSGERTFAIPSNMVEQVLELKQEALDEMRAEGSATWKDQKYPFHYLPRLLGDGKSQPVAGRFHWVLLLRVGTNAIALYIDELRGNQEVVVKNAGPQFTRLQGFSGATVLADGEVSLIINPVVLAELQQTALAQAEAAVAAGETVVETVREIAYVPTVMVVDDSLTVRKITSRLLEREGYRVVTAKDGVDALEQLVETMPDVMLLDIEMPRMDGYDLTRNIRADERLRPLPIIMITSRMADKHRNYAFEIGVNHYLGKPYNEEELLGLIKGFVAR